MVEGETVAGGAGHACASLAAQSEVGDQFHVALVLGAGQVVEQAAAMPNHLEQSTARVIVVLVGAQVLRKGVDAPGEQCDLDVSRSSVAVVEPMLFDRLGSLGLSKGHTVR